ncbi:MAG TPA: phosphatidylglycerophosphatase A [Gammaproteobacteria bacterium]
MQSVADKYSPPRLKAQLLRDPVHFLALGFGSGLSPKAPGTFGTLAAIPIYLLLDQLSLLIYLGITVLLFLAGIVICDGSAKKLGVHDHPGIVWDEVVGFLVTMTAAPGGVYWVLIGFVLFRLFDILKPWPIRAIDRGVAGGLGIMLDDLLAGVMAALVLQLGAWWLH